jgi:hypothetical protein
MKRHIEKLSEADVLGQYPIFAPAQPDNPAASLGLLLRRLQGRPRSIRGSPILYLPVADT